MIDSTDRLLERLKSEPVPLLPPDEAEAMRQALVPRIAAFGRVVAERRRRRARQVRIGAVALAATVLLAWGGLSWRASSQASALATTQPSEVIGSREGNPAESTSVVRLRGDDVIVTEAGGRADVELESGTAVAVDESTVLRLEPAAASEVLALSRGRISLDVPPLPAGRVLRVKTPHALVTVHGTRFQVAVVPSPVDGVPRTHVTVSEGLVSVQSGAQNVLLSAGSSWSSASVDPPSAATAEPPPDGGSSPRPPQAPARSSVGDLNAENRLFAAALAAKAKGDDKKASELLERLITKHPTSPLVPSARKEREMLLRMQGGKGSSP